MNQKKRRRQRGIDSGYTLSLWERARQAAKDSRGDDENQQAVQKMQNEVDQVIAPNLLSCKEVIERERLVKDGARRNQIPTELAKPNLSISLDGGQIVKYERGIERIPVGGQGACEKCGTNKNYRQRLCVVALLPAGVALSHIPNLFRNRNMRF